MSRTFLPLLVAVTALAIALLQQPGPAAANPLTGVAAIAVGSEHSCALTASGGVKCWGSNAHGQVGDGTVGNWRTIPADVVGLGSGVAAVTVGIGHTCALTTVGGVKCWGNNEQGQLGDGSTMNRRTPVDLLELGADVTAISAGGYHTCAVTATGGLKCWGYNLNGALGDGTTENRAAPVDVVGLATDVAMVDAGLFHTCALTTAGGAKCWGANGSGELGDGTTTQRTTPVDVTGLATGVAAVSAGYFHSCALMEQGGAKCWGPNYFGRLGDGTTTDRPSPADVVGFADDIAMISAGDHQTCAVTAGGGAKCWGGNLYGELGASVVERCSPDDEPCNTTPSDVAGLTSGVAAIAAGSLYTCAVTAAGGVKCWGFNYAAQLGEGQTCGVECPLPVDVVAVRKTPAGDGNCSHSVDSIDALLVLQYSARLLGFLACERAADADENGTINSIDATLILQYVAGLIPGL